MPEPINSSTAPNYTPYDPSQDQSRSDGTGGATGANPNAGAEGAGNVTKSPPPPEAPGGSLCLPEAMSTLAECGKAYLMRKVPGPDRNLAYLACAANAAALAKCLTGDSSTKAP